MLEERKTFNNCPILQTLSLVHDKKNYCRFISFHRCFFSLSLFVFALYLSFYLSFSLSLSVCHSFSLSLFVFLSITLYFSFSLSLFKYIFFFDCFFFSFFLCRSISQQICLSSVYRSLLTVCSLFLFFNSSLPIFSPSPVKSLFTYISSTLCLSLGLSLSLSLSLASTF
jgi:hypothetical protein